MPRIGGRSAQAPQGRRAPARLHRAGARSSVQPPKAGRALAGEPGKGRGPSRERPQPRCRRSGGVQPRSRSTRANAFGEQQAPS